MGPLNSARQRDFVSALVAEARAAGHEVRELGSIDEAGVADGGYFLRPALVLDPALPSAVEADEGLLEEALLNLVKNAIEALESGGRVRVVARRAGRHGLELLVEDDGPGIPDYVLPNVFKPFYTTREQGTGIGLALCKKIVDAHGGEIRAGRSSLGGASFTILLPLA